MKIGDALAERSRAASAASRLPVPVPEVTRRSTDNDRRNVTTEAKVIQGIEEARQAEAPETKSREIPNPQEPPRTPKLNTRIVLLASDKVLSGGLVQKGEGEVRRDPRCGLWQFVDLACVGT